MPDMSTQYVSIQKDASIGTAYAEFKPDLSTMSVSLTLPVNGAPTTLLQKLKFMLSNDGYYFGKLKRTMKRQLPNGCILHVLYGGQKVFTLDVNLLFAEYQEFESIDIMPNTTNTAIVFNEICPPDTTTFPTLRLTNVSIEYQGELPSLSVLPESMSSSAVGTFSSSSIGPIYPVSVSSLGTSTSTAPASNSVLVVATSPVRSISSASPLASSTSTKRSRRIVTITHKVCPSP
jgi:hypothetical protein